MEPSVAAQAASLQRQLDDCRASLAAALARLEVVRTRERHLLQEISRGSDPGSDHGGPTVPASPSGRPGVEDTAGGPSSASPPSPRPSRRKAAFPAFIVHQEGRRRLQVGLERQRPAAPGGLLLSQDELLIVQVLAHIPREAYGGLAPCHPGSPSGRLLPAKVGRPGLCWQAVALALAQRPAPAPAPVCLQRPLPDADGMACSALRCARS